MGGEKKSVNYPSWFRVQLMENQCAVWPKAWKMGRWMSRGCGERGGGGKQNGIQGTGSENHVSRLCRPREEGEIWTIVPLLSTTTFFSRYHVGSNSVNTCDAFSQQFGKEDAAAIVGLTDVGIKHVLDILLYAKFVQQCHGSYCFSFSPCKPLP